jgi:CHASE3 domain sensor protein
MARKLFNPLVMGMTLLLGLSAMACMRQQLANQAAQKAGTEHAYQVSFSGMPR